MFPMKLARRPLNAWAPLPQHFHRLGYRSESCLDSKGELDADVDLAGHLDDLGELDGLFGSALEVLNGEDLQAGLVDLEGIC